MPTDPRAAAATTAVRCPACGVPLRLREQRFSGTTFPCPECRESLALMPGEGDSLVVQRAASLAPTPAPRLLGSSRGALSWQWPTLSPLFVAWGLAGLVAVVLVGAVVRDHLAANAPRLPIAKANAAPVTETDAVEVPPQVKEIPANPVAEVIRPSEPPPSDTVFPEAPPPTDVTPAAPELPVSALSVAPVAPVAIARPDSSVLLGQRLVSFQQTRPVARRAVLQTIEDLLDRPVRVADDVPAEIAARLDAAVTVTLENVTVEELLRAVLRDTGLEFVCTPDAVQLRGAK